MKKILLIITISIFASFDLVAYDYFIGFETGHTNKSYSYCEAQSNYGIIFGLEHNSYTFLTDFRFVHYQNIYNEGLINQKSNGYRLGIDAVYNVLDGEIKPYFGLSTTFYIDDFLISTSKTIKTNTTYDHITYIPIRGYHGLNFGPVIGIEYLTKSNIIVGFYLKSLSDIVWKQQDSELNFNIFIKFKL